MKVLNLYAGVGGNRKLWTDVSVTAVEHDPEIAAVYRDLYPMDTVVEADAHQYLKDHYHEYDFIWSSPPCPTHSQIRKVKAEPGGQNDPTYPDMNLYEEILFLDGYFGGDWVVENVNSWYDPLVQPTIIGKHYLWSNFHISDVDVPPQNHQATDLEQLQKHVGIDLSGYEFPGEFETGLRDNPRDKKIRVLRNCVHPDLGNHVMDAATTHRQATLTGIT